ncbi:MAG: hypothetical protein K1X92_17575, partial [Bacteroidia bacterium]|nr:hypothetical protein [Bacteroidia bacterium]
MEQQEKYQQLLRLTALWALVESGLGGMMHAFHLPFTGLVLGGFSILILSLIARGSQHVFGRVIKATLIVIAVKAAVNPFTSPMAYIAVGFQGVCAALLFSISINSRILFMVFGAITMMESAVQKLLVLTLIFGQTWWKALNAWAESVTQLFGVVTQSEGSTYIIGGYLGLFIVWGLILGNWMYYLPRQIREREQKYAHIVPEPSIETPLKTGKKTTITVFILFIFLASGLWLSTEKGALSAFMLLVRTVVVVILWIYL